jgi:hypothetical protein
LVQRTINAKAYTGTSTTQQPSTAFKTHKDKKEGYSVSSDSADEYYFYIILTRGKVKYGESV